MSEEGVGYVMPGEGLLGLVMITLVIGIAYVGGIAPWRLLNGDAETRGQFAAGALGLGVWTANLAALATLL